MTTSRRQLRRYFPLPLVAAAVLLLVLIFLTPNLISRATPSAGTLPTQAILKIDRLPASNVTHLYLESLGGVRFATLSIAVSANASWSPPPRLDRLRWDPATNGSNVLAESARTTHNPFVVNVSATYVDSDGVAIVYGGLLEVYVVSDTMYFATLTPGLPSISPTPVSSLPITELLATLSETTPR